MPEKQTNLDKHNLTEAFVVRLESECENVSHNVGPWALYSLV